MDLSLSGLASGFDWKSVVDQLVEIERAPQRRARSEQYDVSRRNQLLGNIKDTPEHGWNDRTISALTTLTLEVRAYLPSCASYWYVRVLPVRYFRPLARC